MQADHGQKTALNPTFLAFATATPVKSSDPLLTEMTIFEPSTAFILRLDISSIVSLKSSNECGEIKASSALILMFC